jgi:hypothetical protein
MRRRRAVLLFFVSAGMEMCWLYALAAFSMVAVAARSFPFAGAIGVFLFAAALTHISTGRGWRVLYVLLLQACGITSAVAALIHQVYYAHSQFFAAAWFNDLVNRPRTAIEWVHLIMLLIWTLLFWIAGVTFSRRPRDYFKVCSRFDIGLAAFFLLFLIKCILVSRAGVQVDDLVSGQSFYPFFLLSLLAIGIARIRHDEPKTFIPGFQGIGITASFAAIVIVSAGSLVLFFLPALTAAAEAGYRALKSGGRTFLPFVEGIVRFMMTGKIRPEPANSPPSGGQIDWSSSLHSTWWMEIVNKVIEWGFWGLFIVAMLFTLGLLVYSLIRWLLSKTGRVKGQSDGPDDPFFLFVHFWRLLISLYRVVRRSLKGYRRAGELYSALNRWGRNTGLARVASETPAEFGSRLNRHFPRFAREIGLIVDAFHREAYGETRLTLDQLAGARSAWYRMRNPLFWPLRVKVRFFR